MESYIIKKFFLPCVLFDKEKFYQCIEFVYKEEERKRIKYLKEKGLL